MAMVRRFVLSMLVVAAISAAAAPQIISIAGKKPGSTPVTPSITLDQASPHFGDTVTFTTVYEPMKWVARIVVYCDQDGVTNYQSQEVAYSSFTLSGGWWFGGAADCTAKLFYFTYRGQDETGVVYLAETTFATAA
jgi:hypothetical protein